jgi:hypothetical protein
MRAKVKVANGYYILGEKLKLRKLIRVILSFMLLLFMPLSQMMDDTKSEIMVHCLLRQGLL